MRIDLSEYSEQHSVARLIGAPPGYIGHDEGGQLTEAVRRKPYSIVLFDEVEKAHKSFLAMLLQVMDDGRLTDSHGRTIDFSNTILLLTSNLGAQYLLKEMEEKQRRESVSSAGPGGGIGKRGRGAAGEPTTDYSSSTDMDVDGGAAPAGGMTSNAGGISAETEAKVMSAVKAHFAPEFLNRLTDIIVFRPLTRRDLHSILEHQLQELAKRLEDRDIEVTATAGALDHIVAEAYNPAYGGRPLRRYLEKHLATQLSRLIIGGKLPDHSIVTVKAGTGTGAHHGLPGYGGTFAAAPDALQFDVQQKMAP